MIDKYHQYHDQEQMQAKLLYYSAHKNELDIIYAVGYIQLLYAKRFHAHTMIL